MFSKNASFVSVRNLSTGPPGIMYKVWTPLIFVELKNLLAFVNSSFTVLPPGFLLSVEHVQVMSNSWGAPWSPDNPNTPDILSWLHTWEKNYFAGILVGAMLYGRLNNMHILLC